MLEVFLFQQLIEDLDFSNIRNLIVDENFRIYKIDSSMAFHADPELIRELNATRFSHRLLNAIKALDRTQIDSRLGPWLTKTQRKSLWARRNEILKRAEKLIAAKGEDAVSVLNRPSDGSQTGPKDPSLERERRLLTV